MTLLTEKLQEEARIKRMRDEMRAAERARFTNPDADWELESVWVAHVWVPENGVPDKGEWMFAGFRRRRQRRKPQTMGRFFARVRRQLGVDKKAPVMLMSMADARVRLRGADQSWRHHAPQFQTRRAKPKPVMPAIDRTKRKQRATVKAPLLNKRDSKFIAMGRHEWDRKPGYRYFGPLSATQKRLAVFEAKRLYGAIYSDVLVVGVDELSKPLRQAMASGKRVRAGVTRIRWPEVPPTFDDMWQKFVKRHPDTPIPAVPVLMPDGRMRAGVMMIEDYMRVVWEHKGSPWLTVGWFRKAMRAMLTPSKIIWKNAAFHCTSCWSTAKRPFIIEHTSSDCVPTTLLGDKQCADAAKLHAKRKDDRKRKRLARRADAKKIAARRHAQKLAARKRRRVAAKARVITRSSRKPSCTRKGSVTKTVRAVLRFIRPKTGASRKRSG